MLFEFGIYDKENGCFLSLERRLGLMDGTGIPTVPVGHRGAAKHEQLLGLITEPAFDAQFDNPLTRPMSQLGARSE